MFDTLITVVGNLVADPRFTVTKDGLAVCSFRIAATPRRFNRSTAEWRDGDTLFANVTCWRGLAENVVASLKKGSSAIVYGRLSVRPYETKDGDKRQSVDIDAMAIGPELGRVVTVVKRAERGVSSAQVTDDESAGESTEPEGAALPVAGAADWGGWSAPSQLVDGDTADPADDEYTVAELAVGLDLAELADGDGLAEVATPAEPAAASAPLAGSGGRWRSRGSGG